MKFEHTTKTKSWDYVLWNVEVFGKSKEAQTTGINSGRRGNRGTAPLRQSLVGFSKDFGDAVRRKMSEDRKQGKP